MYHRLTVNFAFPPEEWNLMEEICTESNKSYSSYIKDLVHEHYQSIIKERSIVQEQVEPSVQFYTPAQQFVKSRCDLNPSGYTSIDDLWRACRKYYQEEQIGKSARTLGGRRKLFATLDTVPKISRVNQPNGRLKGFRGIDLL